MTYPNDRSGATPDPATPAETASVPAVAPSSDTKPSQSSKGWGRRLLTMVLVGLGAYLVVALVATIDMARTDGQVMRRTILGDEKVAGLDRDEVESSIEQLEGALALTSLTISVGEARIVTDPVTVGASLDQKNLTEMALDARRRSSFLTRPLAWGQTFLSDEIIELQYVVDSETVHEVSLELLGEVVDGPKEPDFLLSDGEITVQPGQNATSFDPDQLVAALPTELEGPAPYEIGLIEVESEPRFSDQEIEQLAAEVNEATRALIRFRVLNEQTELEPAEVRPWIILDLSGDEPDWGIDLDQALETLEPRFPELGSADQQARFDVVDNKPIILPASETVICCDEDSLAALKGALLERTEDQEAQEADPENGEPPLPVKVVDLDAEIVGPDRGVAELEALGIVEEVSSFTTKHACCQQRVTNIHRFADLVRGAIIRPGESFSLNGHVGRRTIEKGFVADSAISHGVLVPQVGGGVSQFATTFFNAAFFAGIDFNEYQSHSLYISRYPKGREATISFPKPDLSVKNTTDYGILVWPTYTDTSITVRFFSTKHIEVDLRDIQLSHRDQCEIWTTPRIRTYPDGKTVEDSVFALYRPGEGFDCAGNPTEPPEENDGKDTPQPEPAEQTPDVTTPGRGDE